MPNRPVAEWTATVLLAACVVLLGSPPAAAGDRLGRLTVEGRERSYLLVTPGRATRPVTPLPLVIVLHGAYGSGELARQYFPWDATAARSPLAVVYPNAIAGVWNDGRRDIVSRRLGQRPADDVGFLVTLVRELVRDGIADPTRVYVAGVSNGGMMAMRLACEAADMLAAAAAVIANFPSELAAECRPARPVHLLVMNGTADTVMPYKGGGIGFLGQRGSVLSTEDTVARWRALNRCGGGGATRQPLANPDRRDGNTRVERVSFPPCAGGDVVLYAVQGGGHQVPSRSRAALAIPDVVLGPRNRDIEAADVVWEFFKGRSRPR